MPILFRNYRGLTYEKIFIILFGLDQEANFAQGDRKTIFFTVTRDVVRTGPISLRAKIFI